MDNLDKQKEELYNKYDWLKSSIPDIGEYFDELPDGWMVFIPDMCEELDAVIKKNNLKDYRVVQIKEKFAELRWYDNTCDKDINYVISKYAHISRYTCGYCGDKATYISDGWYFPYCTKCKEKYHIKNFYPIEEFYKN